MSSIPLDPIIAVLLTSLVGATVLAAVRDYRWSARLNVLFCLSALLFALRDVHLKAGREHEQELAELGKKIGDGMVIAEQFQHVRSENDAEQQ